MDALPLRIEVRTLEVDAEHAGDARIANMQPGEEGLRMKEALTVLRGLQGLDIIGADVVCLIPTKDAPNRITAMNATAIMFELICLIADRLRGRPT